MKFRSTKKWDDVSNSEALLYFAQMMEEMLFDFSLDTYKPSVMHSGLLVSEALQTISEVETGNIKEPNIGHVIAELTANLESDSIANSIISLPIASILSILKNPKAGRTELKSTLEILAVQLSRQKYRKEAEKLLSTEIKLNAHPEKIRKLIRCYATSMIACGFSSKHLLENVKSFFFHSPNRIAGNLAIDDFLSAFPSKSDTYQVLFKVDASLISAAPTLDAAGLILSKELPAEFGAPNYSHFTKLGEQEYYAYVKNIEAFDQYGARQVAERLIRLCSTLFNLFHHKKNPGWSAECLAINDRTKECKIISKPVNPMQKCSDLVESVATQRLQKFASSFSLEKDSFIKFIRSSQLHSLALSSQNEENQILNLWISLESLVPSESKNSNASNIEHIVESITPFLNEGYIQRLINNLVKDLVRWDRTALHKALNGISGTKLVARTAKLLILKEHEIARDELENNTSRFPLLRDRIDHFKTILNSPKSVLTAIDAHQQRLEWQIRRIYRARNIIVHSGRIPSYTQPLIEHAHDYLDTILARLVELASTPKQVHSVTQGFKYTQLAYEDFRRSLSKADLKFSKDNIEALLFKSQPISLSE